MHTYSSDQAAEYEALLAQYVREIHPSLGGTAKTQVVEELRTHALTCGISREEAIERLRQRLGIKFRSRPANFGDLARACRDQDGGRLSVSEKRFVKDMCVRGFNFVPSERQRAWLESIFARLSARAA